MVFSGCFTVGQVNDHGLLTVACFVVLQWFAEVKMAWPGVFLSLYVEGLPDSRITALPDYDRSSAAHSYPWQYSAAQVAVFVPHIDQVMYAGFGDVDPFFLRSNTLVPCNTNGSLSDDNIWRCGANNAMQVLSYALNGTSESSGKACQVGFGCIVFQKNTESLSESGTKWMSGGTKRQCNRTLISGRWWRSPELAMCAGFVERRGSEREACVRRGLVQHLDQCLRGAAHWHPPRTGKHLILPFGKLGQTGRSENVGTVNRHLGF